MIISLRDALYLGILTSLLSACAENLPQYGNSPFAPGVSSRTNADGLNAGHRLMDAGEYDLALKAYYRAAAQQGASVDVLSGIGSANLKLGRINQAEYILRRAIEADERFVPAWNNLGVVLMEQGKYAEASRVFQTAFALDSGRTDAIRENLMLSLAKIQRPAYDPPEAPPFKLIRRGPGDYELQTQR